MVSVVLAVWAGTVVRHHVRGDDPVDVARDATRAYADGDCVALRRLVEDPAAVPCAHVDAVRAAYRAEGLRADDFTYRLLARAGDVATVRVASSGTSATLTEVVSLERHDGRWRIVVADLAR